MHALHTVQKQPEYIIFYFKDPTDGTSLLIAADTTSLHVLRLLVAPLCRLMVSFRRGCMHCSCHRWPQTGAQQQEPPLWQITLTEKQRI